MKWIMFFGFVFVFTAGDPPVDTVKVRSFQQMYVMNQDMDSIKLMMKQLKQSFNIPDTIQSDTIMFNSH
ncbi:MAG: hypothetical protein A2Y71_03750 [Bacteroidetes bacterium RBG_13_42_15]|nr:MAG: hypothetical protein A2Y71_03750 [Bacteroidetes bacterium RBG_13_42_15]